MNEKKLIEPIFSVDLGDNGGVIAPVDFDHFVDIATAEQEAWRWLNSELDQSLSTTILPHVQSHLGSVLNAANAIKAAENLTGNDPSGLLRSIYLGQTPVLFHSTSETGRAIFAIERQLGPTKAALAYALLAGTIAPNLRDVDHIRVLMLSCNPMMIDPSATLLGSEAAHKSAAMKLSTIGDEQRRFLTSSKQQWASLTNSAEKVARKTVFRVFRANVTARRQLALSGQNSIDDINQTKATYDQFMQLGASVQYWEDKKTAHIAAQSTAFSHLKTFGKWAAVLAATAFSLALIFMLEASGVELLEPLNLSRADGKPLPSASYLIVTAAMGTILTVLFWSARILVKNYLTERRLAMDAEERRVMTQTYLALTNEGKASEEERLIILNALFRPAVDLSGKDDGPSDIALPALIAKLLDQRMSVKS